MTNPSNEREIVLDILLEITRDKSFSHIALNNALTKYQYLDKRQRAFITRVVDGTLEHMIEIDYIINQFSKTKVNKMKPVIRTLIRSGVYQIKYMDSVPDSAVCNEAVKLAGKRGFAGLRGFVNGVLRNIARELPKVKYPNRKDQPAYFSVMYSMPEWIVSQWLSEYKEEVVETMLQSFQKETPTTIRCNLSNLSVEELIAELKEEGVTVEKHPYLPYALWISGYDYLADLESFLNGDFFVQDISSMLMSEIVGVKEGDAILDVCAAPGGKALHLADQLNGTGKVEARDLSDGKVELIWDNIERSRFSNIQARKQDATVFVPEDEEKWDVVICDLPCSGLGVLGKKTDLKYNATKEMQADLVQLQRQILDVAHRYVKPGGTLIYSTCTVYEGENQKNVEWFLKEHPAFTPQPFEEILPMELKLAQEQGMLQLLPGVHQSDGFFIAKFEKH